VARDLNLALASAGILFVFNILYAIRRPLAGRKSRSHMISSAGQMAAHGQVRPFGGPPHVAQPGGYAMRTFDLAPLYRSTVGFDRLFSMLDGFESAPGYPPYNIERTGENEYRITVAVAGFGENELSLEAKENTLTIKGAKQAPEAQSGEVLYQGIAARAFERVFQLADYVVVKAAKLENGLLHVDLVREIPEAKKPRQIPIGNGQAKPQVLDTKAAA
jgi:molecular chaperone IbpA